MREIKFRAWSNKWGKMILPEDQEYSIDVHAKSIWKGGIDDDSPNLLQFTGLHDKNEKEIYEGDWCRAMFRDRNGIQVIQGKIIIDDFMWCIDCTGSVGNDIFSINRPYDFEIIGNIYEHPNLIP